MAVRQREGEIPRFGRRQRGANEPSFNPFSRGAASFAKVSQPLNHHAAAEHVRQPCDVTPVTVGILKGACKLRGYENRKVCVFRLALRVPIGVSVYGQDILQRLILRGHFAVGAHAEGANLVIKSRRVENRLDFVKLIGDFFCPCGRNFYANTNIHG